MIDETKFYYVIRMDPRGSANNVPTMKHQTESDAMREAHRLCEVTGGTFGVFEFMGQVVPPQRSMWVKAVDLPF